MQKRLISINEASEYLGISVNTLYSWVSQKKINYVKIGRLTKFDLRVLDRYIDNNTTATFFSYANLSVRLNS